LDYGILSLELNKKIYEDLNKVVIYFQSDHKKENRIKKF